MRGPSSSLLIMILTAPNNYIFNERRKEVLTIKAFNSASVENFTQMKLRIATQIEVRNETADVVVIILHVKGKISTEAVS